MRLKFQTYFPCCEWTEDEFDFSQYEDAYRAQVMDLIDAKVKGEESVAPESEEERPETINLMDELKQNLSKPKRQLKRPSKSRQRSA